MKSSLLMFISLFQEYSLLRQVDIISFCNFALFWLYVVSRPHEIAITCGVVFCNFAVFTCQVIDCSPLMLMVSRLISRYSKSNFNSKLQSVKNLLAILVCQPVRQFSSVSSVVPLMFSDFASKFEVEVEAFGLTHALTLIFCLPTLHIWLKILALQFVQFET